MIDRVRRPVDAGSGYRLRCLRRDRYLELFVDDRLVFSTVLPTDGGVGASVGCVIESGAARFEALTAHRLEPLPRGAAR